MTESDFAGLLSEIRQHAASARDFPSLQEFCVRLLAERLPHYNWVGFYMLDPADENTLVLGPFRGAPTEHVRIPVSQGICGAAVAQRETVVIDDVSADPRYLACSLETKSEIVVPIYVQHEGAGAIDHNKVAGESKIAGEDRVIREGKVVGEIDIDSHILNAFTPADRTFLEQCAEILGQFLTHQPTR
jgi:GAF domain-containing protein